MGAATCSQRHLHQASADSLKAGCGQDRPIYSMLPRILYPINKAVERTNSRFRDRCVACSRVAVVGFSDPCIPIQARRRCGLVCRNGVHLILFSFFLLFDWRPCHTLALLRCDLGHKLSRMYRQSDFYPKIATLTIRDSLLSLHESLPF